MIGVALLTLALVLGAIQNVVAQTTVDTGSWEGNGGNATDTYYTEEQEAAMKLKKGVNSATKLWPDGEDGNPRVPYVFADNVNQDTIKPGLDHWMEHTCIKFEELEANNTAQPHVKFINGSGCYSYTGMDSTKNGQPLSVGTGCEHIGTVVRDIGHALGFYHETSRKDRDEAITVLWDNVYPGAESVYDKFLDNNYGVPYDLTSVMHYKPFWYGIGWGLPTIITKDPMLQQVPHFNRYGLTHRDMLTANRMYGCIDNWLALCGNPFDWCFNDGYIGKNCTCICPPGTTGALCENITGDYYAAQLNSNNERISSETTLLIDTPLGPGIFAKVITPPSCHRAVLNVTIADMYSNCDYQWLVVRTDPEDDYGRRLCGTSVTPGVRITSESEIIITVYNFLNYRDPGNKILEADITIESIYGCTTPTPAPSCPAHPDPICPECPSTPAPPRPAHISPCVNGGTKHLLVLPKGESITIISPDFPEPYPSSKISCGWKLKAAAGGSLDINCDTFDIDKYDKVKLQVPPIRYFRDDYALTSNPNSMIITFISRGRNSGPGFRCTVSSQ